VDVIGARVEDEAMHRGEQEHGAALAALERPFLAKSLLPVAAAEPEPEHEERGDEPG
jgi:hypothetical protein